MTIKLLTIVFGVAVSFIAAAQDVQENPQTMPPIPVVPLAVAKKDLSPIQSSKEKVAPVLSANAVDSALKNHASVQSQTGELDRSTITMKQGVNEIVRVAIGHLNRIVTPFEYPSVTTSSDATTEIRDNVIYVGTNLEAPVTLFITEANSEDKSLSLTLIPQRIPPREIYLKLPNTVTSVASNNRAKAWETSQPYMVTIEELLRNLALGKIPSGYTAADASDLRLALPACRQNGITVTFGYQTFVGHHFIVHVGLGLNTAKEVLEIDEDACADWDIAAVAAFPNFVLAPQQKTEVYVVQKRNYVEQIQLERKSLIAGDFK